jgi:hypothetical protein
MLEYLLQHDKVIVGHLIADLIEYNYKNDIDNDYLPNKKINKKFMGEYFIFYYFF